MAGLGAVAPPMLAELQPVDPEGADVLELEQALVERTGDRPLHPGRLTITDSELRGVTIEMRNGRGFRLGDVLLRGCDLANIDASDGSILRVEIHDSRLTGFAFGDGRADELAVRDSNLTLASFARTRVRSAVFERVDLSEASFMDARLEWVLFSDCALRGADFRGATLKDCAIRGSSLDGVLGIDSLAGVAMPWTDLVASAAALATALGIVIEPD